MGAAAVKFLRGVWLWGPALACAAAIHYGSMRPVLPVVVPPVPHSDKLLHAAAYGLLALLLARALHGSSQAALGELALAACLWATAFGGIEEILQLFLTDRSAEVGDVLANAFGAALAACVWKSVVAWRLRK